jgi:hypothetical protein
LQLSKCCSLKTLKFQGFDVFRNQCFRISRFQDFSDSRFRGFWVLRFLGIEVFENQGFRVSGLLVFRFSRFIGISFEQSRNQGLDSWILILRFLGFLGFEISGFPCSKDSRFQSFIVPRNQGFYNSRF